MDLSLSKVLVKRGTPVDGIMLQYKATSDAQDRVYGFKTLCYVMQSVCLMSSIAIPTILFEFARFSCVHVQCLHRSDVSESTIYLSQSKAR